MVPRALEGRCPGLPIKVHLKHPQKFQAPLAETSIGSQGLFTHILTVSFFPLSLVPFHVRFLLMLDIQRPLPEKASTFNFNIFCGCLNV